MQYSRMQYSLANHVAVDLCSNYCLKLVKCWVHSEEASNSKSKISACMCMCTYNQFLIQKLSMVLCIVFAIFLPSMNGSLAFEQGKKKQEKGFSQADGSFKIQLKVCPYLKVFVSLFYITFQIQDQKREIFVSA